MNHRIEGRILRKKSISKKLMFFDIENERRTAMLKFGVTPPKNILKARQGKDKLHVGDVVLFFGVNDDDPDVFAAVDYEIIEKWNSAVNGAFVSSCYKSCDKNNSIDSCKSSTSSNQLNRDIKRTEIIASNNHQEQSRHTRARLFAEWIVETYDLKPEDLVLDVAGGRGDLAFELGIRRHFRTIIVDPRNLEKMLYKKWQRKLMKKAGKTSLSRLETEFNAEFLRNYSNLFEKTSLVIGLHPDEATESIISTCLHRCKNFAVIPCCVFAYSNLHRIEEFGGTIPNTYEKFIFYLKNMNPKIQEDKLNFTGRNVVLYYKNEGDRSNNSS